MADIHTDKGTVKQYFNEVYHDKATLENVPWVTGAVGIEILKKIINKQIPAGMSILDVGCGFGTEAVFMARHGHRVAAIDADPAIIAKAEKYAALLDTKVDFRVQNFLEIEQLKEFAGAFDIVTDQGCFHHILPQDRQAYKNAVKYCLKSGGRYFMRGFSYLMPPSTSGNGPIRLTSDDILNTFLTDFYVEEMYVFDNIPVAGKEDVPQKFWFTALRKR